MAVNGNECRPALARPANAQPTFHLKGWNVWCNINFVLKFDADSESDSDLAPINLSSVATLPSERLKFLIYHKFYYVAYIKRWVYNISKLPITKTLRKMRDRKPIYQYLRNWDLQNLAKLVFAKPCESSETNVKLRKSVCEIFQVSNLLHAKPWLAKHDLRNMVKQCESLVELDGSARLATVSEGGFSASERWNLS